MPLFATLTQVKRTTKSRNLEASRKEILAAAFHEIFALGFQGVSVDDIVKKTSLTKGAFYHQFPTKWDLGYALVEEVITPMILDRWIKPLDSYDNPADGILRQMQKNMGEVEPRLLKLGCPLNNLVQEMAPVDAGFKKRLQKALNLWVDETNIHLKRAQKAGQLKSDLNTKEAAYFIVMAHEGFYGLIKGVDDPNLFKSLFRSLRLYFNSISN